MNEAEPGLQLGRWRVREREVDAVQVTATNGRAVAAWCGGWACDDLRWSENMHCYRYPDDTDAVIEYSGWSQSLAGAMFSSWGDEPTPGAVMLAYGLPAVVGQWVARVEGRHVVLADDEFRARYDDGRPMLTGEQLAELAARVPSTAPTYGSGAWPSLPMLETFVGEVRDLIGRAGTVTVFGSAAMMVWLVREVAETPAPAWIADGERVPWWRPEPGEPVTGLVGWYLDARVVVPEDIPWLNTMLVTGHVDGELVDGALCRMDVSGWPA